MTEIYAVVTGLGAGNGVVSESGFDITPASEIMAIFCLANDIDDLRRKIEKIIVGYDMETRYRKRPRTPGLYRRFAKKCD